VPEELAHERDTETPDFAVRLALGVEVGSTLTTTHAETGKSILERLLKTEELQDGQVDRRVETETTLVRTESRVVLKRAVVDWLNPNQEKLIHT